jgi:hypothetical protein
MKLTAAQGKWLLHARKAGYESGFRARYNPALGRLEALGYIELNPSSPGPLAGHSEGSCGACIVTI